ncbi:MAG: RNA polymerase-associated protein RapA [Metallibacterium sp.]
MELTPGQRWISSAEPELGLATVLRVDVRSVQMLFARSGVLRQYARESAPFLRAEFRVGQRIAGKGRNLVIERVEIRDGLLVYSGDGMEMHEGELDDEQPVSQADERLMAGRVDAPRVFTLRLEALQRRQHARASACWGLASARIAALPHQLRVAEAADARLAPRLLLADEAGLGKTIEAGMIVARLLASGRGARVLVLLPETLLSQWFVELLRRFNLSFALYDEERCEAIESAGDARNPFADEQHVLASLAWLEAHPQRQEQLLAAGWDMLVVDEAHHLEWKPTQVSARYALVERLAAVTPGLLLLTATPEQLGREGHFARLRLLDPARYASLDAWLAETAGYPARSALALRLEAGAELSAAQRAELAALFAAEPELLAALHAYPGARATPRLLDALIDRHGTGRVMFRHRRASIGGFAPRQPRLVLVAAGDDDDARQHLFAEFSADTQQPSAALEFDYTRDARLDWLLQLLDAHVGEKFLLLCHSEAKVLALETALRPRSGIGVARFHESLGLLQRDRAAAWFAAPDGARLLLCSEIGSEGRNFQFAHHLVLWDLPLDPDLLEQRIGRLDRIGQAHAIQIHHHALHGSAQHALARWYDEGCDAFRSSPADGRALLRRFGVPLRELALAHARGAEDADQELDVLVAETRAAHVELCAAIEHGRDRLLELAAQRAAPAQALLHALQTEDADTAQADFALRLLEQYGVHHDAFEDGSVLLDPEYLTTDALPELKDGPLRATFQRDVALAREELALLRLDHPLLQGALDLLLGSELGNASFLVDDTLPARSAVLQAVFVLECVAERALDVDRFLPPTPLAISVDSKLAERDAFAPADNALRRASEKPLDPARYRKFLGRLVPPMLERAQQLVRAQADGLVAEARARMSASLDAEITRLEALRQINPSVRADELDGLRAQRDALATALNGTRLRLDAVRFVVSLDFLTLK